MIPTHKKIEYPIGLLMQGLHLLGRDLYSLSIGKHEGREGYSVGVVGGSTPPPPTPDRLYNLSLYFIGTLGFGL